MCVKNCAPCVGLLFAACTGSNQLVGAAPTTDLCCFLSSLTTGDGARSSFFLFFVFVRLGLRLEKTRKTSLPCKAVSLLIQFGAVMFGWRQLLFFLFAASGPKQLRVWPMWPEIGTGIGDARAVNRAGFSQPEESKYRTVATPVLR